MKYVSYVDTLGFKNKISMLSQDKAIEFISNFNSRIYRLWESLGYNSDTSISGRTFSDSILVHTTDNTDQSLSKLLEFLVRIYRISLTECGLPLRGGITVGEFDDIPMKEFRNLRKGLVVGKAFIDAFILEANAGIKGSKIVFRQEVNLKINNISKKYITKPLRKDTSNRNIYELKWADIVYLVENDYQNLDKFVDLATDSRWLDHYYQTLETFLINERSEDKNDVYQRLIDYIEKKYKFNDFDCFIENFMKSSCSQNLKRSFLKFIREKL